MFTNVRSFSRDPLNYPASGEVRVVSPLLGDLAIMTDLSNPNTGTTLQVDRPEAVAAGNVLYAPFGVERLLVLAVNVAAGTLEVQRAYNGYAEGLYKGMALRLWSRSNSAVERTVELLLEQRVARTSARCDWTIAAPRYAGAESSYPPALLSDVRVSDDGYRVSFDVPDPFYNNTLHCLRIPPRSACLRSRHGGFITPGEIVLWDE